MPVDIKYAHYIKDLKLYLEFDNGVSGTIDFQGLLNKGKLKQLQNIDTFKTFTISEDSGTIVWEDLNIDLDPCELYKIMQKQLQITLQHA